MIVVVKGKREIAMLLMALSYLSANADDINDVFADSTEDDPDNEAGNIYFEIGSTFFRGPGFTEDEAMNLQQQLAEGYVDHEQPD